VSGLVLDCSVTMAWLFEDEGNDYTESALVAIEGGDEAWVPALWPLEVSNVLLMGERRGRIGPSQSRAFWDVLVALGIRIDADTASHARGQALRLAREYGLTAYDGAYLELALRRGCALVSLDSKLTQAAGNAGLPGFSP
jgi:predicted nucleic acid-binding protein